MKTLITSLRLWLVTLVVFGIGYPSIVYCLSFISPFGELGAVYQNVGQAVSDIRLFWPRPSAVGYNAASTGGSNHGPSNQIHLDQVKARIDSILKYHPYLQGHPIPTEWVTASGSGIDPHISYQMAQLQVQRVAEANHVRTTVIQALVDAHVERHSFGPDSLINYTALNKALISTIKAIN